MPQRQRSPPACLPPLAALLRSHHPFMKGSSSARPKLGAFSVRTADRGRFRLWGLRTIVAAVDMRADRATGVPFPWPPPFRPLHRRPCHCGGRPCHAPHHCCVRPTDPCAVRGAGTSAVWSVAGEWEGEGAAMHENHQGSERRFPVTQAGVPPAGQGRAGRRGTCRRR